MHRCLLLVGLVACWHTSPGPEPVRWRDKTPVVDLLPDGAWLVAAMDFDTAGSKEQRANENKALSDPNSIRNGEGGCTIPATHAMLAVYGRDEYAVVTRGVFRADAMIDCLARTSKDAVVTHTTIAGHDVLSIQTGKKPFLFIASDTGVLIAATELEMTRALATHLLRVPIRSSHR